MQEKLILKNGEYKLKDTMTYPNGGTSYFYVHDDQMIVIDDNICNITDQDTRFDYSLITDKQNNYMKQYAKLFRFLKSDIDTIDDVLDISEKNDGEFKLKSTVNRENNAETSPLEWNFEKNFADVYGRESLKYLWKEYGISDWQGNNYFLDYFIHAKSGDIAVEENGVKTFLVVFSTASGKSKIIEEDIKEFSEKYDRFKALILVPNSGREKNKKPLEVMKVLVDSNPHIYCNEFENEQSEAQTIPRIIQQILEKSPGETISVLARTNRLLELAFQETKNAGIKCEKSKRKSDFETPYILWMFLALKLSNHRTDKRILKEIVGVLSGGLDFDINEDEVILESDLTDGDLLKALRTKCSGMFEDEKFEKSFSLNLIEGKSFVQFIEDGFKWAESKIDKIDDAANKEQVSQNYEIEKKVWIDFQRHLGYNYNLEEILLSTYIQEFSMVSKEEEPCEDAVQFLTIHASKGKEFDHVILIGMANDELPSFQSLKKGLQSTEMEEERRNCFVAITRAKKVLYLTYAKSYFGWKKEKSIFLNEMFS